MRADQIVMGAKVAVGMAGSAATSMVDDVFVVDMLIAVLGGFIAMTPREKGGSLQWWDGFVGVMLGVSVGLVLRSGDMGDLMVRAVILPAAILSTMIVHWLRNPAQGLEAVKAFVGIIQKVLSAITGK